MFFIFNHTHDDDTSAVCRDEYCVEFGSGDGRAVLDALLKVNGISLRQKHD